MLSLFSFVGFLLIGVIILIIIVKKWVCELFVRDVIL